MAFALGCFPNDPLSAETLLRLTQDTDEDVRDWATFGLGVLGNTDSDEIREVLSSDSPTLMKTCAKRLWSGWAREKTGVCSQPS